MIFEYALEPEMVAAWGSAHNSRFFSREFGLGQGRLVSRYPKNWARKVWDSYQGANQMDRKRLEELLIRLQATMVKRKDYVWDDTQDTWLKNALLEHGRHPFKLILARTNPGNQPEILAEDSLEASPCPGWDNPHGITVNRNALEMAAALRAMLSRCRWVRFVDPYISQCNSRHRQSLAAFLEILITDRPVGRPDSIEIHTRGDVAAIEHQRRFYERIIPSGIKVSVFQWRERTGGQRLHNRYILTDLGGVSFHHGLDCGFEGETDDITRLGREQYERRCMQYIKNSSAFDKVIDPLEIVGTYRT